MLMSEKSREILLLFASVWLLFSQTDVAKAQPDAPTLVRQAIQYWRDKSSFSKADMFVHRPNWERQSSVEVWTRETTHSLVRFTAPAKDVGNASLTIDEEMWSFSPKVNRTIKIPPSMKHQNWMGSDFSYEDLSKGDSILKDYDHKLIGTEQVDGKKVYVIESIPKEDAPVVWGKEVLKIREDNLILEHDFYDQDGKLVKKLEALEIRNLGGKLYATRARMTNLEEQDEWTEFRTKEAQFGLSLPDTVFSLSNLSAKR